MLCFIDRNMLAWYCATSESEQRVLKNCLFTHFEIKNICWKRHRFFWLRSSFSARITFYLTDFYHFLTINILRKTFLNCKTVPGSWRQIESASYSSQTITEQAIESFACSSEPGKMKERNENLIFSSSCNRIFTVLVSLLFFSYKNPILNKSLSKYWQDQSRIDPWLFQMSLQFFDRGACIA